MIYLILDNTALQLIIENKPAPYVYKVTHKITGQFYIGYREVNVKSDTLAKDDFGVKYFTSSAKVKKMGFENFTWEILGEFLTGNDAFDYEQQKIWECWGDPKLLNGTCKRVSEDKMRFKSSGGWHHTPEAKERISKSQPDTKGKNHRYYGKKRPDFAVKVAGHKNPAFDHTIYHLWHVEYGEEFLTQYDFREKYGFSRPDIHGLTHPGSEGSCLKGWYLFENKHKYYEKQQLIDKRNIEINTVYHWYHSDHGDIFSSSFDLCNTHIEQKLNIDEIISVGKQTRLYHKGWVLFSNKDVNIKLQYNSDINITNWSHPIFGDISCTRRELINKFPDQKLWSGPLGALIRKEVTHHKGWTIKP